MGPFEPQPLGERQGRDAAAGVTRRAVVAAAWSVPVVAAVAAAPVAAASATPELTAWTVTACESADRITLMLRNDTADPLQTYLELTADGAQPDAGPGPLLSPGETRPFGFGLVPNGGYTIRASTDEGLRFQQRVELDCAPLGLTARIDPDDGSGVLTVHVRNDSTAPMTVTVAFDLGSDGSPESTDTVVLAPGEERALPYPAPQTDFTVRVSNDQGYALVESFAFA